MTSKKTGVLLIQLGTPDSPDRGDVARYLREFLTDPRVIDIPFITRQLLVRGIIVPFRAPKSAKIYKELWALGNGVSPLMTYSEAVKKLVQERFDANEDVTVELAMRYQNPSMDSVLERMRKAHYDQLIIIPLFPQYASASTGSAIDKVMEIVRKWWVIPEVKIVSQFYDHESYIDSVVARAQEFNLGDYDKIMFSYHGLPERHVDKVYDDTLCADHNCEHEVAEDAKFCYKATCYATTRLIAAKLGLSEDQYIVSFQSRLNQKWIQPFSDEVIRQWGKDGVKKVLAFSPAFVADCLETLIEIGDEYNELLIEHGGEHVQLVPSSNDHPRFIDCLEDLVRKRLPQ
ncbi:MAG: ferrochelatase [Candidatus Fluviicola riflensis]|nr:MAG: ferrochelatase [Candidatus Fluviicola riflensis]OGS76810.1 MAG: ferrochelatase [Candidatus Fluviicola riflensis]OGS82835.1 MAG: ferrochelatase [Fluviicola sp. RIFCSPHIGHO2_01_FULL_43_53]OGS88540.1 MAG: ferrochelatase [Fluviicola sp. RIFCSPHIGHO2_12_FULL_43_24]